MEEKDEKKNNFFENLEDDTLSFSKEEIEDGKVMGVISYLIPFVPYLTEKNNGFVKYHAKQGMNLMMVYIMYLFLQISVGFIKVRRTICDGRVEYWQTPQWLEFPLKVILLCILGLVVWGIVDVCNGKARKLPILNKIKIIK